MSEHAAHDAGLSYDRLVRQVIPGYESLAALSVAMLAAALPPEVSAPQVLMVGCGTGAELLAATRFEPDWRLTGVDASAEMLAVAGQRLADLGATATLVPSRVEDLPQEARFDGATAILVLHLIPDDGSKLAFLAAIARRLTPGAGLILVDLLAQSDPVLQAQLDAAEDRFQRYNGLGPDEREQLRRQTAEETYRVPPSRIAGLLNAAGFSDPVPFYQSGDYIGWFVKRR